jgi:hypothetical protein
MGHFWNVGQLELGVFASFSAPLTGAVLVDR